MRVLITTSSVLLIMLTGMLTVSLLIEDEYQYQDEIFVNVPEAIVINTLTDLAAYQQWCDAVVQSELISERERKIIYQSGGHRLLFREKIEVFPVQRMVYIAQPKNTGTNSIAQNLSHKIQINALADGSLRVLWQINYEVKPLLARFINRFFLSEHIQILVNNILRDLKTELEQ
ncbi:MAG: hypothetical protein GF313_06320 [Caldithrix sp.]|nr:hypothetical protein [Caldithrix sp.]